MEVGTVRSQVSNGVSDSWNDELRHANRLSFVGYGRAETELHAKSVLIAGRSVLKWKEWEFHNCKSVVCLGHRNHPIEENWESPKEFPLDGRSLDAIALLTKRAVPIEPIRLWSGGSLRACLIHHFEHIFLISISVSVFFLFIAVHFDDPRIWCTKNRKISIWRCAGQHPMGENASRERIASFVIIIKSTGFNHAFFWCSLILLAVWQIFNGAAVSSWWATHRIAFDAFLFLSPSDWFGFQRFHEPSNADIEMKWSVREIENRELQFSMAECDGLCEMRWVAITGCQCVFGVNRIDWWRTLCGEPTNRTIVAMSKHVFSGIRSSIWQPLTRYRSCRSFRSCRLPQSMTLFDQSAFFSRLPRRFEKWFVFRFVSRRFFLAFSPSPLPITSNRIECNRLLTQPNIQISKANDNWLTFFPISISNRNSPQGTRQSNAIDVIAVKCRQTSSIWLKIIKICSGFFFFSRFGLEVSLETEVDASVSGEYDWVMIDF